MVSLKFAETPAAAGTAEGPPLMPPARFMADETTAKLFLGGNGGGGPEIYNTAFGCLEVLDPCSNNANFDFMLIAHGIRQVRHEKKTTFDPPLNFSVCRPYYNFYS